MLHFNPKKQNTLPRALLAAIIIIFVTHTFGRNPFLPPTAFIPDGEPHVFEYKGEQRLFVYGSRDERITGYCGYGHDAWSAPVSDLTQWMNHGEIFNVKQVWDIGFGIVEEQHFGAPDCVYNPITKKYYLYTFLGQVYSMDGKQGPLPEATNYVPGFGQNGPKCVMAISESPAGPFLNPVMCNWPPANDAGTFDPSVLVDQQADGSVKVFAYWGMKEGDRWAEIDPYDMHTIINSESGKPDINAWHKTLDPELIKTSSVFEASSIKKVSDGKYVFIYSSNERKSALTYCYSNRPEGPWNLGGEIIHNDIHWKGGNNHGSIVKVLGKWYVVYHRPTNDSKNRQAMMEPIAVILDHDKVTIPTVNMTSQGVENEGLFAYQRYNANIVCYRTNSAFINSIPRQPDGLNPIQGIEGPVTLIGFKYFNFGKQNVTNKDRLKLKLNAKVMNSTHIKVLVSLPEDGNMERNRIEIADIDLDANAAEDIVIPITELDNNASLNKIGGLKEKLSVFLSFSGREGELCELKEMEFAKGDEPTPNPLHAIYIAPDQKHLVSSIPTKCRAGESVKLSILPKTGYKVQSIQLRDENNNKVKLEPNGLAPYAPLSYNFYMPNFDVKVDVDFVKNKD